jgi:apolipoprotein N-acyltransferase
MAFAVRRPLFGIAAMLATAALLIAGNGMEPRWGLMWVALFPVLWFAATSESWLLTGAAAFFSLLVGSYPMLRYLHGALHLPVIAWLAPFGIASLIFAGDVLLFRGLLRRGSVWSAAVAFPALWTVIEFAASFVPANGTGGSLAYTQLGFLPLLQLASITGPWGISFLLFLFPSTVVAAGFARRTQRRKAVGVVAAMCATLGAVLAFGAIRLNTPPASATVRVGLLVTDSVDLADAGAQAEDLLKQYAGQAEDLARRGAQIIVMPEKIAVVRGLDVPGVDALFQSVADRTDTMLVAGVLHVDGTERLNEARIYTPHLASTTYDKEHMLPPFESDLKPGTSLALLRERTVGVAICKDMDFIRPSREYGRAGIDLLLDPAWDFNVDRAWHGHIAIMRGVENGYAIAHAAKDGFLTVTDDRGRILGEVQSGSAPFASLLVEIPMRHDDTIFNRFGAWFPWFAALLLAGAVVRLVRPGMRG